MAVVYLAHDLKHRRPVALKIIHPDRTIAVALAFRGDSAAAVREGEAGLALIKDFLSGIESAYLLRQMTLAYHLAGDQERARATLDVCWEFSGNTRPSGCGRIRRSVPCHPERSEGPRRA